MGTIWGMTLAMKQNDTNNDLIGRLKSLGVKYEAQIPLLLPKGYKDYSRVADSVYGYPFGESILVRLNRTTLPKVNWGNKPPYTSIDFVDDFGYPVSVSFFGDARKEAEILKGGTVFFISGKLGAFGSKYTISNPQIIPKQNVGRLIPAYPGKAKVIKSETVQQKVLESLDMIPKAAEHIRSMMMLKTPVQEKELLGSLGAPNISLERLIYLAHLPRYENEGFNASAILKKLSALFTIRVGRATVDHRVNPNAVVPISQQQLSDAVRGFPYPLTDEQKAAIVGIARELAEPRAIQALVSADVGAGKSSILGVLAKTASDIGSFVVVMAPNTGLCIQLLNDFKKWWPDIDAALVIGDTKGLPDAKILIGTTALLHRLKRSKRQPDILMVDEEQRFGTQQREELKAAHTNYISSTATCVPRTMQLVMLGAVSVYRLTKIHVKKEINTKVISNNEKNFLMNEVHRILNEGKQVLIMYPVAESKAKPEPKKQNNSKKSSSPKGLSAEKAKEIWERHYPGRVALVHGKMENDEKQAAIESVKNGEKDILVCTTVIEVGIHIPNLYMAIVSNADRYGLSQLHQIRGRVAREGGKGYFYLNTPPNVSEDTMARLEVMETISDGFKIAEEDTRIRGFGDLSSGSKGQTGKYPSLCPNYEISVDDVKSIMDLNIE